MEMLKQWILRLGFVRNEIDRAEKRGYMIDVDERANEKVSALLGTVDERKVIRTGLDKQKGMIFLGDEMLDPATVHNLRQEAEIIDKLELWHLMTNTIRATAHKRVFVDSKDINDIMAGKMALYNLDLMKKILTVFLAK